MEKVEQPVITVLGCGYVGLTTAVLLANCGFQVYAIEPHEERLKAIQSGRSFFYEDGINPLLAKVVESKQLQVGKDYDSFVPDSDIIFSCVGTPDNPDGSSNLTFVFDAAKTALQHMKPGAIYVQKSTVPVGTGEKIEKLFKAAGKDFSYVSNPEFLREGTAIGDTLWFDRVVVGSDDQAAAEKVLGLYKTLEAKRGELAKVAGLQTPKNAPEAQYIATSRNSAELIKVTSNAFLSLKISFANSIAKLADKAGADVTEVMAAVGADRRIGTAFLQAGRGYGGGCFPKDVSGLIRSAEDYGVGMEIMDAASEVNSSMPHYVIEKVTEAMDNSPQGKKVAVLGLAFKPGTSDVRRSPAIVIANTLASMGAVVSAYDPQATEEAKPDLTSRVTLCEDIAVAVKDAECVFVATDWPEFTDTAWTSSAPNMKYIVDCMNSLDKTNLPEHIIYIGVGKR